MSPFSPLPVPLPAHADGLYALERSARSNPHAAALLAYIHQLEAAVVESERLRLALGRELVEVRQADQLWMAVAHEAALPWRRQDNAVTPAEDCPERELVADLGHGWRVERIPTGPADRSTPPDPRSGDEPDPGLRGDDRDRLCADRPHEYQL